MRYVTGGKGDGGVGRLVSFTGSQPSPSARDCSAWFCIAIAQLSSFVLYVLYKKYIAKMLFFFGIVFYLREITLPDFITRKGLVPIIHFLTYE